MDKLLLALMLAGSAIDIGTTEKALAAGGRELNPLMAKRGVRIVVNIAAPVAIWKATRHLEAKPRRTLYVSYAALKIYLGTRNMSVARSVARREERKRK